MAKVVAAPGLDSLDFCGGALKGRTLVKRKTPSELRGRTLVKRKTPSELRGEQLKRRNAAEVVHESSAPLEYKDGDSAIKKPEGSRTTKYVDTRLNELFHAIKPTSRLSMRNVKSNFEENKSGEDKGVIKSSLLSRLTLKSHQERKCKHPSVTDANVYVSKCQTSSKDNQRRFRSVAELSLGSDKFSQMDTADMDLKGLFARKTSGSCLPPIVAGEPCDGKSASLGKTCSEIHIPGRKIPLDFTLKTSMRIVSLYPVNRFHRLLMGDTYNGMTPFSFRSGCLGNQSASYASNSLASTDSCSLNSWIYPQSLLPPSVMSILNSSAGGVEMDFINKRKLAWEDSFRSLYYMLRKNKCDIFYVCTSQFVVMFNAVGGTGKSKRICNAYISQSTTGLRHLLKEHDICFLMPLCRTKLEEISSEDLVELSEMEKHNLGQAKRSSSMPDLDNSPQSLLALNRNDSVHGLYEFLLNYRSSLSALTTVTSADVPILCAPIPFLHAAISSPDVKCKEMKRVDALQSKGSVTKDSESMDGSTSGICYSVEIKDMYIPPWTVSSLCSAMGSEGRSFEASFVTEPSSMGLNAALETVIEKSNSDETSGDSQEPNPTFGISAAIVNSSLSSASLKSLKYSDGSCVAYLAHV